MATVANLTGNIRIIQHQTDHDPPHFHAQQAGREVLIRIADLSTYHGELPRSAHRLVLTWASRHQAELALNWVLARADIKPRKIDVP